MRLLLGSTCTVMGVSVSLHRHRCRWRRHPLVIQDMRARAAAFTRFVCASSFWRSGGYMCDCVCVYVFVCVGSDMPPLCCCRPFLLLLLEETL